MMVLKTLLLIMCFWDWKNELLIGKERPAPREWGKSHAQKARRSIAVVTEIVYFVSYDKNSKESLL